MEYLGSIRNIFEFKKSIQFFKKIFYKNVKHNINIVSQMSR